MPQLEYSGEPGCKTAKEINQRFRHYLDPTSYWECGRQGERATSKRCPTNQLFSDKAKRCVEWKDWQWMETQEPPSQPDN